MNKALQIFLPVFLILVVSALIFLIPWGVIPSCEFGGISIWPLWAGIPADKFIHVVFPGLFTFFLARSFDKSNARLSVKGISTYGEATLMAMLAVLAIGVALEVLQLWTPGRTFDYYDLLANAIGIGIGGLVRVVMGKLTEKG